MNTLPLSECEIATVADQPVRHAKRPLASIVTAVVDRCARWVRRPAVARIDHSTEKELVDLVTHSARKAGATLREERDGAQMRFVFHGPAGEINAGEFSHNRRAALVSACQALYDSRPR